MSNHVIYYSRDLYHHGIKGQKWGVRRYQNKDGSLTARGRKRYSEDDGNKTEPGTETTKKGLTDKQKKAIIAGAAVVATGLAIYGGYKVSQIYKGSNSPIDPETGFRLLKDNADKADLHKINPGRIRFMRPTTKNVEIIEGSSTNCMLCTTAYELRQRGFDVHAGLEKTGRGFMPQDLFPKLFSDFKETTKLSPGDSMSKIENFIKNEGNGSRGNVVVWWKHGGGHSMIWENVDGNVVFKDGQTGQVYKNFAKTILKHASDSQPIEMLRTDNLKLNTSDIKNFVNTDTILKTYVDHGGEIVKNVANDPVGQFIAMNAAVPVGTVALIKASNKSAVNNYKKQHPNTRMSDKEILNMLVAQNRQF